MKKVRHFAGILKKQEKAIKRLIHACACVIISVRILRMLCVSNFRRSFRKSTVVYLASNRAETAPVIMLITRGAGDHKDGSRGWSRADRN